MFSIKDLEDVTIARNLQAITKDKAETRRLKEEGQFAKEMTVALRTKNNTIESLRGELLEAVNACNVRNEVINAERLALKHFMQEYAKATGKPLEEVREFANRLRTKAYDRFVDQAIQDGQVAIDPRQAEANAAALTPWYEP